jgi:hypothetical protein
MSPKFFAMYAEIMRRLHKYFTSVASVAPVASSDKTPWAPSARRITQRCGPSSSTSPPRSFGDPLGYSYPIPDKDRGNTAPSATARDAAGQEEPGARLPGHVRRACRPFAPKM